MVSGPVLLGNPSSGNPKETSSGDTATVPSGATIQVNGTANMAVAALTGVISPASIGANQNDYSPAGLSGASRMRLTSSAAYDITGIAGGSTGRLLVIHNVGSFKLTLKNENAGSAAANRIIGCGGLDVPIFPNYSVTLCYDGTSSRWRPLDCDIIYQENFERTATYSYTGSVAWQQVNRWTTASLLAGDYEIRFAFVRGADDASKYVRFRVQVDDTTNLLNPATGYIQGELNSVGEMVTESGFRRVTLGAGTHNIDLDLQLEDSGKTGYVHQASVSIRRV